MARTRHQGHRQEPGSQRRSVQDGGLALGVGAIFTAAGLAWCAGCGSTGGLLEGLSGLFGGSPVVTSVSPLLGPASGGTAITVIGDGFTQGTSVLFGETAATEVTVVNSGLMTAKSPAHPAGTVSIQLATASGDRVMTGYVFTYESADAASKPLPSIGSVAPDRGPTSGGTCLTISGSEFEDGMVVVIGAFLGTDVHVVDSRTLTVQTPPQGTGPVSIILRTKEGRSTVLADGFTYEAPAVRTVAPASGPTAGGTRVTLTGAQFSPGMAVLFDSVAGNDLVLVNDTTLSIRTPAHGPGVVNIDVIASDGTRTTLPAAFEYFAPPASDPVQGGPKLVSAISTGNTRVLVTFSEAVGEGADDPAHYCIVQQNVNPEAGVLIVLGAAPSSDRTSVLLTTRSQNELVYLLSVTDIKDLAGNPLPAPTVLVDPTRTTFAGTPPVDDGADSDEDGLSDAVEQKGRTVTVKLANGQIVVRGVTSDPTLADTDGDGLDDADEEAIGSDPRRADTDGDRVPDAEEWNEWYSDPTAQDTDVDGLGDSLEIYFRTSPVIADTDGDQMSDPVEILERNRNPLIADLPLPQITVDEVRLGLKVTSTYTDEQGSVQSVSDTTATSLAQSRSDKLSRSDTNSTESENTYSQKLGFEYKWGAGKDVWTGKIAGETGFGQKRTRGFSSTVSSETARASQQEYQRSVSKALMTSQRRAVTRNIDQASIQANVNIANRSDIAFTITNIEVSVQQQDRRNGRLFRPIATLRPQGASILEQPKYNLGPFDPERGPIIFQNVEIFPNLVDDLMREPTGLIFQVVNYDILDEFGRNFVFSSQEVNDRTAGITIDFGDGVVESYRVATAGKFDDAGRALGISLQRALEIAGIGRTPGDDAPLTPADPLPDAVRKTYGTITGDDGAERLVRVRGVQSDLVGVPEAEKRFWAIITSNTDLSPDAGFSTVQIRAGDDFLLLYTRDVDQDNLFEREEYLYGSNDRDPDSDRDSLPDYDEVRTGWTVYKKPGLPYRTFPDPVREDSDGDSLRDDVEKKRGTDPNRSDTDEDGLPDAAEAFETLEVVLFDGDSLDQNNKVLLIRPYTSWTVIDGGNGVADVTAGGDDIQLVPVGNAVLPGRVILAPGPNGVLDSEPAGDDIASLAEAIDAGPDDVLDTTPEANSDDFVTTDDYGRPILLAGLNGTIDTTPLDDDFVRVAHDGRFATDPLNQDTDYDGIPDGRELLIGTNPNCRDAGKVTDSDGDGLYDSEEDAGWSVVVRHVHVDDDNDGRIDEDPANGLDDDVDGELDEDGLLTATTYHVKSNKFRSDSDLDGLPDAFEWAIRSDPKARDTDADQLSDVEEFNPDDGNEPGMDHYYADAAMELARYRCEHAASCQVPTKPSDPLRTNVVSDDSDADGRTDWQEVNVPWTVSVPELVANPTYRVFSKAWSADFDHDGLEDGDELSELTDPNKGDTDEDGNEAKGIVGLDGHEVTVGRDPLRKDQKVTFTFTKLIQYNICDDSGEEAEWNGHLYLSYPGAAGGAWDAWSCLDCVHWQSYTTVAINRSASFYLRTGDSIRAYTNTWWECDSSGCGDDPYDPYDYEDESVGSMTESFTYPVGPETAGLLSEWLGGEDCSNSLAVEYSIAVE